MDCETLSRYLDLYLDAELAEQERAEVEAHLRGCEPCRQAAAAEVRFRVGLREALQAARAPASLREQVARRVRAEAHASSRWTTTLAVAAAILVIGVVGYGVVSTVAPPADPMGEVVAAHQSAVNSEVFGTSDRVLDFLNTHAPFAYRVPLPEGPDVRLVGARVSRVGLEPAVLYLYDVAGRRVTIAQYPQHPGERLEPSLDRRAGYLVATYGEGGLAHTVVGDLPDREVRRFLPASYEVGR